MFPKLCLSLLLQNIIFSYPMKIFHSLTVSLHRTFNINFAYCLSYLFLLPFISLFVQLCPSNFLSLTSILLSFFSLLYVFIFLPQSTSDRVYLPIYVNPPLSMGMTYFSLVPPSLFFLRLSINLIETLSFFSIYHCSTNFLPILLLLLSINLIETLCCFSIYHCSANFLPILLLLLSINLNATFSLSFIFSLSASSCRALILSVQLS